MDPASYLEHLGSALQKYHYDEVRPLTDQIDPSLFTSQQAKKALGLLRRRRRFVDLEHLAMLFIVGGKCEPHIRRQWAQALLDQNRLERGLSVLSDMAQKVETDPVEGPEVRGLIGRAYKQRYVSEGGEENLRRAIASYEGDWLAKRGDYRWQGINVAALIARGTRDGVDLKPVETAEEIALAVRDEIETNQLSNVWDYATALEASVALADQASALKWAKVYVQHPGADAFELGSTLRQLKEVWRLEKTALGQILLPPLECALLQKNDASLEPVKLAGKIKTEGFEAVWGDHSIVNIEWFESLRERLHAIARIKNSVSGRAWGTGFLALGSLFRPKWKDNLVLITNAHVVSHNPADEASLRPDEAVAEFTRLADSPRVVLGKMLYTSPRFQFDVSIFELVSPNGCCSLSPAIRLPLVDDPDPMKRRVYVVGHPNGEKLGVSLYDNSVAEYDGCYVRYRSPTEGGNSGSPVFDCQLSAFAVHHRAREDKKLNEGVLLRDIQAALCTE